MKMEKIVGEGVKFERIRRVTGYLSGDVSRFNNGKRAEEHDRVCHGDGRKHHLQRRIYSKFQAVRDAAGDDTEAVRSCQKQGR